MEDREMSAPIDEGGPAFPCMRVDANVVPKSPLVPHSHGLTLRDYFAGQAMAGMLANSSNLAEQAWRSDKCLAEWSYKAADAMIAERGISL